MKKISLLLVLVLIVSIFSACGKKDTAGNNVADEKDFISSPAPTVELSPVSSEEPLSSPQPSFEPVERNFPDDHWSKNVSDAPAVPLDGMSAPEGMVPLKELPGDYSAEQAEADGCYGEYFADHEIITFGELINFFEFFTTNWLSPR